MSSKKKKRNQEFLKRQKKRGKSKLSEKEYNDVIRNGTIKEIANAMGIQLN